jgi:hypothetical protein
MSALETTVRVNSERQTLILAGEPVPRRPLTIIATPVDDPLLIAQGNSEESNPEVIVLPRNIAVSNPFADRGSGHGGADAYARTQQLTAGNARNAIIDTYA